MPAEVLTSNLSSPVGVHSVETLADGSVLELGGGTRVTVAIGPRERRVRLHEGELFVSVQHETGRPFLVDAGKLEAIATGTAFNVLRTGERTVVTVVEGSVDTVYEHPAAAPNVRLQPGQQLVYSHASHSYDVRQANPDQAIAWRSGMLHFHNELLSEVLETVNRYAARKIVSEDPRIREFPYLGAVRTDDIEGWLEALPDIFPFPVVVADLADGRQLIRQWPGARTD